MSMLVRLFAVLLLTGLSAQAASLLQPNIIFVLADDLGWTGVGCYGSPLYETPNIDRLASQGMKFTQAYAAAPLCSPTRASILIGKYPARLHLTDWIPGETFPNAKMLPPDWTKRLPAGEITIAARLKASGYATACIGKWHLGAEEARPEHYGFDYSVASSARGSTSSYFSPYGNPYLKDGREGEFLTDRLTDEALKWIEANKSKPFFLYLPHFAVHTPIQAKADVTAKYRKKFEAFPNPLHTNATYAALTESVDDSVGRIMRKLDELKLSENTILIFTSDNGGMIKVTSNLPLRSGKASNYEGGVRVPLIVRWPVMVKKGSVCETPVSSPDFYPTFLDAAGAKDDPKHIRDGQSLMPLLRQAGSFKTRDLFWHYPHYNNGNAGHAAPFTAVREGDLRLVHFHEDNHLELYDLKNDIRETNDLANARSADCERLMAKIERWRKDVDAQMPSLNPAYDPAKAWQPQPRRAIQKGKAKAKASQAASRPNILFCFADDWGRYAGAYAALDDHPSLNQIVRTPNLDRVAREGVLFKNAFVTAPSCTPCRSSLLSGQYFWRTGRGAILLNARWDTNIPSYPLLLRDAGYHIGKSYKVWSPGLPVDAPYGGQQYAYEKAGREFNNFSENATRLVKEGLSFEQAKAKMLEQVRQNFADFLAARNPGQPFCFWFGPTLTHRAYEKGSGKALWGIGPDSLKGKLPKHMPDVPEVRADLTDYLGEVQAWDAGIGVLLKELETAGELDRTLLVISGDHGMPGVPGGKCNLYDFGVGVALLARGPGIKGGRVVDDFVNLMDLAPTFLEFGGVKPPSVMTGRSIAGVLRSEKSGQVEAERTWVVTGRERHVDTARPGNLPYPHRAFRTEDFLYIRNFAPDRWPMGSPGFESDTDAPSLAQVETNTRATFSDMDASPTKAWLFSQRSEPQWSWHYNYAFGKRPAEELYDLRKDPDQIKNCAMDAAYAAIRQELSEKLMKVLCDTQDPRVTGDGKTFERSPFTDVETQGGAAKKAKQKRKT